MLIHPETDLDICDPDPTVLEVVDARMQPLELLELSTRYKSKTFMMVLYNGKVAVALGRPALFCDACDALAGGWFAPGVRKLLVPARQWLEFKGRNNVKRGVKGRGFSYYYDPKDPRHLRTSVSQ